MFGLLVSCDRANESEAVVDFQEDAHEIRCTWHSLPLRLVLNPDRIFDSSRLYRLSRERIYRTINELGTTLVALSDSRCLYDTRNFIPPDIFRSSDTTETPYSQMTRVRMYLWLLLLLHSVPSC
jgi:hypothetical protein